MPSNSSGGTHEQPSIDVAILREGADAGTPLVRLSQLLDICDSPRMEFASHVGGTDAAVKEAFRKFEVARRESAAKELLVIVSANPGLDRAEWVRALEIAPEAAVRSPVLKQLLQQQAQIIVEEFELFALGCLARHCASNSGDIEAQSALAELICRGLPEPEPYGGVFLEFDDWTHSSALETDANLSLAANRYSRASAPWIHRGLALHAIGTVIVEVLFASNSDRSRAALAICSRLGRLLIRGTDNWKVYCGFLPFAPEGASQFTEELVRYAHDDTELERHVVFGWRQGDSFGWVNCRPGFFSGIVHESADSAPEPIRQIVDENWHMTDWGDFDCESEWAMRVDQQDGENRVVLIGKGFGRETTILRDCVLEKPFPKPESDRLAVLYGVNSWPARLARNPSVAICPECGEISGRLVGTIHEAGECASCGYVAGSEPEDEDGE
jgi:hypothetical protein